jgi:NADPH:quinone reductase-like Zn-dependent oxidoreductase
MPTNLAAWLNDLGTPLEVRAAEYTSPLENQIVVKNGAVAINPIDHALQTFGPVLFPWLTYPGIFGDDVAGEVVEVGSNVTRFRVGDRVLGYSVVLQSNKPAEGAFQHYTVINENLASHIPDTLSYEEACVIPLTFSTAASSLFFKDHLALEYPTTSPKPTGKTLLVLGGATSVGCNAIQLAVAAGYEVFTTASPRNFDYLKKLGASQVFDYNSENYIQELIQALKGKSFAGAYAAAPGTLAPALEIVSKSDGVKFVSSALPIKDVPIPEGVSAKFVIATDIMTNEVSQVVYRDFLPQALAEGKFIAAPEAHVVGKGLDKIEEAMEVHKKGVSAKKVVVSL